MLFGFKNLGKLFVIIYVTIISSYLNAQESHRKIRLLCSLNSMDTSKFWYVNLLNAFSIPLIEYAKIEISKIPAILKVEYIDHATINDLLESFQQKDLYGIIWISHGSRWKEYQSEILDYCGNTISDILFTRSLTHLRFLGIVCCHSQSFVSELKQLQPHLNIFSPSETKSYSYQGFDEVLAKVRTLLKDQSGENRIGLKNLSQEKFFSIKASNELQLIFCGDIFIAPIFPNQQDLIIYHNDYPECWEKPYIEIRYVYMNNKNMMLIASRTFIKPD